MVTVTQNTGKITLFWVIDGLFQSEITANRITRPIHEQLREIGSWSLANQGVEGKDPTIFSKPGNSNNMTRISSKKRERHVVQLLTTKFRAKAADEPISGEEIRLNPIIKDLIINGYADESNTQAGARKGKKKLKEEAKAGIVKNVE